MSRRSFSVIIGVVIIGLLLSSCSATRDLPEDKLMLNKVHVVADGKYQNINPSQLKDYVRQKGNARWFSAVKIPLGVYAMAGSDTTKWLNRMLRSMGEAPVVYDTLQAHLSCENLRMAMQNKGYLDAQVELYTETKGKKINATYVLHPGPSYAVRHVNYDIQDSVIDRLPIRHNSLLKTGMTFDVEMLNQ